MRMTRRAAMAGLVTLVSGAGRALALDPPVHFMMEDVNGTVVTDEILLDRFSLVFFGYTNCPDVCPTSMLTIANTLKALGKDAEKVLPVFVSLDPERDSRKVLSDYVAAFDERIVALRGPKPFTDAMAQSFGVDYRTVTPDPASPGDYSIDHTAAIFFLGRDASIARRFGPGLTPEAIAAEMRSLMAGNPQ